MEEDVDAKEIAQAHFNSKCLEEQDNPNGVYGYLATVGRLLTHVSESIFAPARGDAISKFIVIKILANNFFIFKHANSRKILALILL